MLQEDSNGEASFEIIDKKNGDSLNTDKTESISSVSSNYSIPSPSVVNIPNTGGNLLSNIPPPSALPNFKLWHTPVPPPAGAAAGAVTTTAVPSLIPPVATTIVQPPPPTTATTAVNIEPFIPAQFSAAIPPSKGIQHGPSVTTTPTPIINEANPNTGGLIGWMKDAVSSGGILQKVAERAKNSIDSVITTLDPQMTEFIHTGGDVELVIASQGVDEIIPIRDAVYVVFGKARVNTVNIEVNEEKSLAIGFNEGIKRLRTRLGTALDQQKLPIIAIENIILHENESLFSVYILMLNDAAKQIKIHTYSQAIPLPVNQLLLQAKTEMVEFAKTCESSEKLIAAYLQSRQDDWQESISGVSKRDLLHLAAKVLVNAYKRNLLSNY